MPVQTKIDRTINNTFCIIISFLISAISGIPIFFLLFFVSVYLYPPITPDGHTVMAIGQMFTSILITVICCIITTVILFKKIKRKFRNF